MEKNIRNKTKSLPELFSSLDLYQLEQVKGSINYGRQLQLQFKRLTSKRFSITKISGVCEREYFNVRRIA